MWTKQWDRGRHMWNYRVNGDYICDIFGRDCPGSRYDSYKYSAYIYYNFGIEAYNILYENDLDVLKLKCLVKAREMGWNIKSLS